MAKPTRTINRLHFGDLDPKRFEDLCLALVYRLGRWQHIAHHGRTGSDDGIDIYGVEEFENQARRTWFVQAKRYQTIRLKDMTGVVDEAVKTGVKPPDVLLLMVSCDVTKRNSEFFIEYATKKGVAQPLVWAASILEAKLYSEYHDLLFAYFGVSLAAERRDRVATVRRNISLANRMRKDFLLPAFDAEEEMREPSVKFRWQRVLIRSIDDNSYPLLVEQAVGISPWFKINLYDFYHNGLEVLFGHVDGIFTEGGKWDVLERGDSRRGKYPQTKFHEIGRIPFENIIDYDLHVNEFGDGPHIYCDYRSNGQPYEDIVYSTVSEPDGHGGFTYNYRLDNVDRTKVG